MPEPSKPAVRILVVGDVIVDHHVYVGTQMRVRDRHKRGASHVVEFGGAAMVERLLASTQDGAAVSRQIHFGPRKDATLYPHCHAVWAPTKAPRSTGSNAETWRAVRELGYGEPCAVLPSDDERAELHRVGAGGSPAPQAEPGRVDASCGSSQRATLDAPYDIVVIDEGGGGFRDRVEWWPKCLTGGAELPQWLVWKMADDLGGGKLGERVQANAELCDRVVVIVSASDLRRAGGDISRGLSWERTALDTSRELRACTAGPLAFAGHVIVTFQGPGALWFNRTTKQPTTSLVFDPSGVEEDPTDVCDGKVFGYQACMAAGLAVGLSWRPGSGDVSPEDLVLRGIRSGLAARRSLFAEGHGPGEFAKPSGFPAQRICKQALDQTPQTFPRIEVPDPAGADDWTILGAAAKAAGASGPLCADARLVALNGRRALSGIPSLSVGHFTTVDRHEIESLRRIQHSIRDYVALSTPKRPLSIAVFGAPGAGKSYLVEELAKHCLDREPLTVNLSQFYEERELIGAFHRVRDLVLAGSTPLVLWDEFDAQEYRWLRLLLAPMQDGTFNDGQIVHPIGKCVFVFAGGTSPTFGEFGPGRETADDPESRREWRHWRSCKGPDFVSRIQGHLDVLGPNARCVADGAGSERVPDRGDVFVPLRRAFFIRGKLTDERGELRSMAPELLDFLLNVPRYTHGSRSLDRVLAALRDAEPPLTQASLPTREVLAQDIQVESATRASATAGGRASVNGIEWTRRFFVERRAVWQAALDARQRVHAAIDARIDEFAGRIHATYMELPAELRSPDIVLEFDKLNDFTKESNRAAARRAAKVLDAAGLRIVDGDAKSGGLPRDTAHAWLSRFLDVAAAEEHEGWCRFHRDRGWKPTAAQHEPSDKPNKLSNALFPWEVLTESNRDKDRRQVRIYLDIVYDLGYAARCD